MYVRGRVVRILRDLTFQIAGPYVLELKISHIFNTFSVELKIKKKPFLLDPHVTRA